MKEKPFVYFECFEHMSEYDPEGAKEAQGRIWKEFAKAAGVDVRTLRRAHNRVVWDGYYGPVSDGEYDDCEDHGNIPPQLDTPIGIYRAKEILRAALQHNPHARYTHPDHGYMCNGTTACLGHNVVDTEPCFHPDHKDGDEGPMFHEEPIDIDPHDIKRAYFNELIAIYGHLNI